MASIVTEVENVDLSFDLRQLADFYQATLGQKLRAENRLRAALQGADESPVDCDPIASHPLVKSYEKTLAWIQREMESALTDHPTYEWLMGIPGINRTCAAKIIALIPMKEEDDFVKFSQLRCYAGIAPEKNKLVKGEKSCFNKRLKTNLYVAFSSMLKAHPVAVRSKHRPEKLYTDIYYNWRSIYKERHGEGEEGKAAGWPDLRQHFAAKNKLLDVFLVHTWRVWRESMGWSIRSLYVHEKLGHQMDYVHADFSSETMAKRKIQEHVRARNKAAKEADMEDLDEDL